MALTTNPNQSWLSTSHPCSNAVANRFSTGHCQQVFNRRISGIHLVQNQMPNLMTRHFPLYCPEAKKAAFNSTGLSNEIWGNNGVKLRIPIVAAIPGDQKYLFFEGISTKSPCWQPFPEELQLSLFVHRCSIWLLRTSETFLGKVVQRMLCSTKNAVKRHSARITLKSLSLQTKAVRLGWLSVAHMYLWCFFEAIWTLISDLPPCKRFTSQAHMVQNRNFCPFFDGTKHGNSDVYNFKHTW